MNDSSEKVLKQREYHKLWTAKNAEKERERQRNAKAKKRAEDRDAYNAYMREWTAKNKDRINALRRERRMNDPEYAERIRARDRTRPKSQVKNTRLRNDYGISLDELNQMRSKQGYCCAICGVHEEKSGIKGLAIDHCHTQGHVRGLLCSRCNTGLGQFKDDIALLNKAIKYLTERR